MRLEEFVKTLVESKAVEGYKLEQIEIDVSIGQDINQLPIIVVGGGRCARITIVECDLPVEVADG